MCDRLQMGTTRTSRAREDNSSPCYAFEPGILKREGGHYYKDVCGTLRANAGDNQMAVAYTLKIRGGRNGYMKDGKLITAGKGALIQIEKSATLGTLQDQTLFVPVKSICLNDQGGAVMNVSIEKAATIRAQTHGHAPIILEKRK